MTVMHQHGSIQSHSLIFFLCYWVHKNTPLPSDFSLTWMFWKLGVVNRFRNHSQPLVSNHCGILWYPLGCSELHQVISQTSWDDSHLRNLWVNDNHKGGALFFVTICYHHFTCLFTLYLGCLELGAALHLLSLGKIQRWTRALPGSTMESGEDQPDQGFGHRKWWDLIGYTDDMGSNSTLWYLEGIESYRSREDRLSLKFNSQVDIGYTLDQLVVWIYSSGYTSRFLGLAGALLQKHRWWNWLVWHVFTSQTWSHNITYDNIWLFIWYKSRRFCSTHVSKF